MRLVALHRKPHTRLRFLVCLALTSLGGFVLPSPSLAADDREGLPREERTVQVLKTASGETFR